MIKRYRHRDNIMTRYHDRSFYRHIFICHRKIYGNGNLLLKSKNRGNDPCDDRFNGIFFSVAFYAAVGKKCPKMSLSI